jgi:hypothetical protein
MNEQQRAVACIRSSTEHIAALIQERDELQKQVWRYEKHGVTCQTYGNKVESTCSECNVHENYTSHNNTDGLCPATKPNGVCGCYEKGFTDGMNEFLLYETTPPAQPAAWVGLMRGVRVDGDSVVISTKNNDAARQLCMALLEKNGGA